MNRNMTTDTNKSRVEVNERLMVSFFAIAEGGRLWPHMHLL